MSTTPRVAVRVRSRRAFSASESFSSPAPSSSATVASVFTVPSGASSYRSAANSRGGVRRNSTAPSRVIASGGRQAEPEVEGRGGIGEELVVESGPGHRHGPRGVTGGAGSRRARAASRESTARSLRRQVCRFLAPGAGGRDDCVMRNRNVGAGAPRRVTQALRYQLDACCEDGRIEAMVVADGDGLPLAASGDTLRVRRGRGPDGARRAAHPRVQRHAARRRPPLGRPDDEGRGRRHRAARVRRRRHAPSAQAASSRAAPRVRCGSSRPDPQGQRSGGIPRYSGS